MSYLEKGEEIRLYERDGDILMAICYMGISLRAIVLSADEGRGYADDRRWLKDAERRPYYVGLFEVDRVADAEDRFGGAPLMVETVDGVRVSSAAPQSVKDYIARR